MVETYYQKNKEKILSQQKKYYQKNKTKCKIRVRKWQENNKDKIKQCILNRDKEKQNGFHRLYRTRHKDRIKARSIVTMAINRGDLIPQYCEICGTTQNIQAHHQNYHKALAVIWLCHKHHTEHHTKLNQNSKLI